MARRMTIPEAAEELEVSTKTIKRWLKSGKLNGAIVGNRWLIEMPDKPIREQPISELDQADQQHEPWGIEGVGDKVRRQKARDNRGTTRETYDELVYLRAELREARRDKEWLKRKVDELTTQIDKLSNRNGEQAAFIFQLQQMLRPVPLTQQSRNQEGAPVPEPHIGQEEA
jgi:excisionase family DNA binding protein